MIIKNKKVFVVGVVFLIISLFFLISFLPQKFTNLNNYCDIHCERKNSSQDCGNWYHFNGCNDFDAPNKTIIGTDNKNKDNWCYKLQGGKCGEFGKLHFFFFLFPLTFMFVILFGVIIFSSFKKVGETNQKGGATKHQ